MSDFEIIKGKWKHSAPWDSDDYLALYVISGTESEPIVSGKDLNDGESFKLPMSLGQMVFLSFTSLMPSTRRKGMNKFKLNESGRLTSEFTFTVVEELERENT